MKNTHCRQEYRPRNHILIFFYPVWTSKKMFFSSEHEFNKALCDTLMRAAWYELLSTMANCSKIVTFLCLGFSIITWVIILKQLFASGSWILVNIPLDFGEWLLNIPMSDQFYLAGLHYPLLLCILTYVYNNSQSGFLITKFNSNII